MAILIDPPAWPAHGTLWSHLVSDTSYEELHDFASRMGLPRRSFDLDHYDVPASRFDDAIALGARNVQGRDIVSILRDSGLRVRKSEREGVLMERRREYLFEQWQGLGLGVERLTDQLAFDVSAWQRLGDELLTRWNEPHRHYHDEQHLEDVLLALDSLELRGEEVTTECLLAAWFHDAIYRGRPGKDERDSAQFAAKALSNFDLDSERVDRVAALVTNTDPLRDVSDAPEGFGVLHDADLSIFAAPRSRYLRYTVGVRQEYSHMPMPEFREARASILASFVDQEAIYLTPTGQELWEARARVNIVEELQTLT